MIDIEKACRASADIAAALEQDPERLKLMARYHHAIVGALNATGDARNEQDALAIFEAMAHTLAQQVGASDQPTRLSMLTYVFARAEVLSEMYRDAGNVSEHRIDVDKRAH